MRSRDMEKEREIGTERNGEREFPISIFNNFLSFDGKERKLKDGRIDDLV
jgi:hypothetical protein